MGLITDNNETADIDEICNLTGWCADINPTLNIKTAKEIFIDLRRHKTELSPLIMYRRGSGEGLLLSVPGVKHQRRLQVVSQYHCTSKKGSTVAVFHGNNNNNKKNKPHYRAAECLLLLFS